MTHKFPKAKYSGTS